MKKWIAVLCIVALGFSVTGCGQKQEASLKQMLSEKLSGEITVSCYDTMMYKDFLENAAKVFEKKHPGTKINVEGFAPMPEVKKMEDGSVMTSSTNNEQEQADYISKVNTELMSGKGADILAMDVLPYYKYADGGQLENLQNYMDADSSFDIKDYKKIYWMQ
ncbi:type 2 periplasmic-binding domain-containing protein [Aminipila terrae]|uniref:Extracellular solute-binding protein n=1 Tax=Aminipila terrae TaxID=2697030 RepID=A0A6P1MIG6_9FIRM|nr:extracellular solute-binding protein [Aminipila terrae]QHI73531.1 extracellular solute-binding protein [Aminipila terrae]